MHVCVFLWKARYVMYIAKLGSRFKGLDERWQAKTISKSDIVSFPLFSRVRGILRVWRRYWHRLQRYAALASVCKSKSNPAMSCTRHTSVPCLAEQGKLRRDGVHRTGPTQERRRGQYALGLLVRQTLGAAARTWKSSVRSRLHTPPLLCSIRNIEKRYGFRASVTNV